MTTRKSYKNRSKEYPKITFQPENQLITHPRVLGQSARESFTDYANARQNETAIVVGQDLQKALDNLTLVGGGTVYLNPGTYVLTSDIYVPSGVTLEGVARDTTIIDCDGAYALRIEGSDAYSTGTVSVTIGATSVTGTTTAWTTDMIGQSIFLEGQWYEITNVTSATALTIADGFQGTITGGSITNQAYVIATVNFTAQISKLTITNATNGGFISQYALEPKIDDIIVYDCGTGMDLDYVVYPRIFTTCDSNGVNLDFNQVWGYEIIFSGFSNSTVGAGVVMTNSGNATFIDSIINGNTGNGLSLTGCSNAAFVSMTINANGGKGVELISGNTDLQFIAATSQGNTSDGYKITATSDRNTISSTTISDNGGYGINIAASSCDNNAIIAPAFNNNTSGNISDSGTSTIIIQQTDQKFGGTGADGALTISSGTTSIDLGAAAVFTKNYSSISITGTGALTFTNPHANGTIIILKSTGDVTLTSSATPMIDTRGMGAAGGAAVGGNPDTNGNSGTAARGYMMNMGAGTGGQYTGPTVGTSGTKASFLVGTTHLSQILAKYPFIGPGAGGGSGSATGNTSTSGKGGRGGGGLIIETLGAWNFTTTNGIRVSGEDGDNATGLNAAGGGGGGAGMFIAVYTTLTANTGTVAVAGGTYGSGNGNAGGGGGASVINDGAAHPGAGDLSRGSAGGDGYAIVEANENFV